MKKLIVVFFIVSWVSLSHAQTAWDGLHFSQNYYGGTARFTAMGGAFAALGGDFSALSVNPAGIGVTRGYELMITPSVMYNVTDATYLNNPATKDAYTRFGLDNLGLSFGVFDNGDGVQLNMGIGYNKVSQSVSRMSVSGYTTDGSYARTLAKDANGIESSEFDGSDVFDLYSWATILAWDTYIIDTLPGATNQYIGITENLDNDDHTGVGGALQQNYYNEVHGSTGEYLVSIGGNIRDQFYFGLNFGMQSIWRSDYRRYTETAVDPNDFGATFSSLSHQSEITTRGTGYNIKLGVIWRPIAGLRWGAYFHSPTWTFLTDESSEYMTSDSDYYGYNTAEHFQENFDYKINTPVKWGTGLAYVIGSSAIISVEYEGQDYGATRMLVRDGNRYVKMSYIGNDPNLYYEDDYTRQYFGLVTNLRAGAEYRLDALSFRLGYAYYGSPVKNDNTLARTIFSAGLGYRTGTFYVDGAYSFSPNNADVYDLYEGGPVMNTDSYIGKISVTLGFRF